MSQSNGGERSMLHQVIDRRLSGKNKSIGNRERFLRRYREQIKDAVRKAVGDRSIKDIEAGADITIPKRDVSEPTFSHAPGGSREMVHPGNQEYLRGDRIQRASRSCSGNERPIGALNQLDTGPSKNSSPGIGCPANQRAGRRRLRGERRGNENFAFRRPVAGRRIAGVVGIAQTAARRSLISNPHVGDHAERFCQHRVMLLDYGV